MKNKKLLIFIAFVLLVSAVFLLTPNQQKKEQQILESTYDLSREYLLLRYRTDNILINAKESTDYSAWDEDMTKLIKDWEIFNKKSQELENSAGKVAEKVAADFKLIKTANALSSKEITNIYDKAPKFKGIAAIAKHLGVDAKRAQLILNQAQDETTAEGWTEAGDTLQKLETTAVVIKDGCKVAGYVGGVVITGGAAGGFAAAGTLAQVTTVVVGVDLALEITEDGAQIALGDRNKVSSFVKDIRTVTEPVATVLTITNIPGNLGTAYGKFESVMVGLEQFRESAQEGKVVGIDLTNFKYNKPFQRIRQAKYPGTVTAAEMEMAEVEAWLQSLNKEYKPMTKEEAVDFLANTTKKTELAKEVEEETKTDKGEDKKGITQKKTVDIPAQIIKVRNVSGSSWMMDACFSSTCWDNLDADPAEDRDLGGIYTMGKVFGDGEGFSKGFQVTQFKDSSALAETSTNSYKLTLYFAIAPFEGPKNKTIDYGTWQNHSVEINANYGDEPVIEWDGNELKQVK
jgi:hypothetical protein